MLCVTGFSDPGADFARLLAAMIIKRLLFVA
jgi:hypothetical protein